MLPPAATMSLITKGGISKGMRKWRWKEWRVEPLVVRQEPKSESVPLVVSSGMHVRFLISAKLFIPLVTAPGISTRPSTNPLEFSDF